MPDAFANRIEEAVADHGEYRERDSGFEHPGASRVAEIMKPALYARAIARAFPGFLPAADWLARSVW